MLIKKEHPKPPASPPKVFIGRIIHSKSLQQLEILPKAALGVKPDGTIAFLSPVEPKINIASILEEQSFSPAQTIHLKQSQFLFPGLIDTHLHAPQWPNLALGMEGTLRDWLEQYTDPLEASYHDTEKARSVYADVVATTLKLGSTTVAYNSSIHAEATNILAQTCFSRGQRAIVGKMCITTSGTHGNCEPSTETSLKESQNSIDFITSLDPDRRLIHPCIQPRGGPYCPPALMCALGKQRSESKAHVQGHMCETQSDIDRTILLHPSFTCYSDMYLHNGLLTDRSILAHCIHLAPKDISNLKLARAGVAHNPNSNTCLRDAQRFERLSASRSLGTRRDIHPLVRRGGLSRHHGRGGSGRYERHAREFRGGEEI